uniref:NmrA-like domain-containing protein n=1 Tax=Manihot esculenta TaxID=3983 RepID=A0A2C9W111_MANES
MGSEKSKILIIGATGYLGEYMVKASLSMAHPIYAYVRPLKASDTNYSSKLQLLRQFQSMGVPVFQVFIN